MAFLTNVIEQLFCSIFFDFIRTTSVQSTKNLRPMPFASSRNILAGLHSHTCGDKIVLYTKIVILFTIFYSYEGHDPWHALTLFATEVQICTVKLGC